MLKNGNLFYCFLNLKNSWFYISNLNNFLSFDLDLSNFFNYSWNFNDLFYNSLYIFIYSYDLGNDSLNFNNFRYFDKFRYDFLNLINSWNGCWSFYNFLHNLLSCNNLLYFGLNSNYLLYNCRNLFYNLRHIRYDFLDFFDSFIDNNFLNNFLYILNLNILLFSFNNFLDELRDLNDFFKNLSDRDDFLNNDLDRNCNLSWNDEYFFNLKRKQFLMVSWHYFVNIQSLWYFRNNFDCGLYFYLMCNNFFFFVSNCNEFINDSIDWFLNLNVDIFDNFNLNNSLLNHRNLNLSLNLTYYYFLYFFLNYFLDDLRNFNNFFYDSRNYDNLFDNFLHLYNFRYFNHFLNDLLNFDSDLLNTVHISRNLYNSLLNISHRLWYFHIMVYNFLYLN